MKGNHSYPKIPAPCEPEYRKGVYAMDGKKTFWAIAVVIALASIAAAVAYFVTRYVGKGGYDCDCDDLYDYDDLDEMDDCECGCISDAKDDTSDEDTSDEE